MTTTALESALREEVAAQMNEDVRRLAHLIHLGILLAGQGQVGEARAAYQQYAIGSGDAEVAAKARQILDRLT